jgi:hypothetical protein
VSVYNEFNRIPGRTLNHIILSHNNSDGIIAVNHITLFVTEIIGLYRLGAVHVSKEIEIETLILQFDFWNRSFPGWIQICKNLAVLPQYPVHVAHVIRRIRILAIIIGGTTLIGTKLFITAPFERFATLKAGTFHFCGCNLSKYLSIG